MKLFTNCIAIGAITLQTATFDAKFVMKTVKIIINKIINIFGNVLRFFNISPIFPFKSVYSFFAAFDKANPPPMKINNILVQFQ